MMKPLGFRLATYIRMDELLTELSAFPDDRLTVERVLRGYREIRAGVKREVDVIHEEND